MKEKIKDYIKTWETRCYLNGIPDEVPKEIHDKAPSYKRICLAILKNDHNLKSLGYSEPKSKYYSMLKRIEISQREVKNKQLELWKNTSHLSIT